MKDYILQEDHRHGHKHVIYQILVRLFGNKKMASTPHGSIEDNGVGKFNDINNEALSALKTFGVTHIWYTGVIEHASMTSYSSFGIAEDNPYVVKGRAGSPYAIKDYYDVSPDLAVNVSNRMIEFEELIERTHRHGLKVIIDFVPNHVARQYSSDNRPPGIHDLGEGDLTHTFFDPNNNFYYVPGENLKVPDPYSPMPIAGLSPKAYKEYPAKATGNDVFHAHPSIHDWFETIKINYGVDYAHGGTQHFDPIPDTWFKMRDILKFWAKKGVDGFRCDFIQYTPPQFWGWVIPQIKSINLEIIFIAEIYIPDQYRDYITIGEFDYLYDKVDLYDTLRELMTGKGSTDVIQNIWRRLRGINKKMLRFLENHDEQRIASRQFSGNPWTGRPAMTISATLYTGPILLYFGQEVGEAAIGANGFSSDDGRTTIFDYWHAPDHQKWMNGGTFNGGLLDEQQTKLRAFYNRLNIICNESEAISTGRLLDTHEINRFLNHDKWYSHRVYSYIRYTDHQKLLILVSFYDHAVELTFSLPRRHQEALDLDADHPIKLTDILNQQRQFCIKNEESKIEIEAWGAYIFELSTN